tara:strand:- start:750 stop:980 length:231 start_codon:yes stop_codon:yes gene_type:complete
LVLTVTLGKQLSKLNTSQNKSEAFLKAAGNYFNEASQQAEAGDLTTAAFLILKALDQERRANGVGLQVLQLIKLSS